MQARSDVKQLAQKALSPALWDIGSTTICYTIRFRDRQSLYAVDDPTDRALDNMNSWGIMPKHPGKLTAL